MTLQVIQMVDMLRTCDQMSLATDEMNEIMSTVMTQLDYARNRMREEMTGEKLGRLAPLYQEMARKLEELRELSVDVAIVAQSAVKTFTPSVRCPDCDLLVPTTDLTRVCEAVYACSACASRLTRP